MKQISTTAPSPRRRWLFRFAALLLPIVILLGIELALRICGVGYKTSFFLRREIGGREMLTDNRQFGWRFFPPAIARTPEPLVFLRKKVPGTTRIFVFGESAAMGDPDPAVGMPRMLHAMLEAKFPQKKFEVVNVAMTAINSHVIREIARDCAPLEGDIWIVYAGNNEVVGPFGGGTVFGPQVPPLGAIRSSIWFKKTRIGQFLAGLQKSPHVEWEGMEMFLRQQVRRDDPRLGKVYANFAENLRDIVRIGKKSGAKVIVSTVAVNLRDSAPFASQPGSVLTDRAAWTNAFAHALRHQAEGKFAEAREAFARAAKLEGGESAFAELRFRSAQCALTVGDVRAASTEFNAAKELDTLRFRADDGITAAIRSLSNSVAFVDAAAHLANASSNGIPGAEFFYEHVHFNFDGNYALARLLLEAVVKQLPADVTQAAGADVPSLDECARRLGWHEWKQREVLQEVRRRLQQPPFTTQIGAAQREAELTRRIDALDVALTPERLRQLAAQNAEVLRRAPDDWVLHEDLAKLFAAGIDVTNAIAQWREVARLLPHDALPFFQLGNLSDQLGRTQDAIGFFRDALRIDPNLVEARNGLGLALASSGHEADGKRELMRAVQTRPRFSPARVNLGQLLAREGKVTEARQQYEAAIAADPNSAAARVNLAKLLSAGGDKASAAKHLREALRINPRHAIAHFNLGNTLAETPGDEAMGHFRAAATLDPNFAEARYAFAMELAKRNRISEALAEFAAAVKLQPNYAEGHFNYGVALAKAQQFNEAAREFRETLRLNPGHVRAAEFLKKAEAFGGR